MKKEGKIEEEKNPVLEAIKDRRSVRYYKPDPLPREVVDKVIEAGNWAPSAGNLQPWRFVVVEDEELRERLSETTIPEWRSVMETLEEDEPERYEIYSTHVDREDPVYYSAPVIVFIIGPSSVNCALACENMMLAAHSLGLGSCYVGWGALAQYDPEAFEILELKAEESILGPIVMGYPEKHPEPPPKDEPEIKWV
ncbi:MAG: nitroreductase family protein [Candidatus Bathyarchaeota archaeon]|jgi:nitroreductase